MSYIGSFSTKYPSKTTIYNYPRKSHQRIAILQSSQTQKSRLSFAQTYRSLDLQSINCDLGYIHEHVHPWLRKSRTRILLLFPRRCVDLCSGGTQHSVMQRIDGKRTLCSYVHVLFFLQLQSQGEGR